MKNKVLLSTLLGSALLVGCTADDALDVRKNVAEGVNPAAPVFTVSFGDELTRASMATNGVDAMKWDAVDKMSLFHGGGDANHDKLTSDNFLASGPVANFNAIYSMSGGEGETPEFTTASMVTAGLAIMVYPADTTFAQQGVNPIINLTMDQTPETKNLTPHISEVLDIHTYDPNDAHSAGYGRKYDLVMRQIGSQLRLTLNGENAGVKGIEFRRVTMTVDDLAHSPFTKNLEVKVGQLRRNVKDDGTLDEESKEVGANIDGHKYWKYSPWMEPAETTVGATGEQAKKNGRSEYIATTDIEDGKTAIFTLLPYEDRPEAKYNAPFANGYDGDAQYTVTIKVETNFGWVEVKDGGDSKLWSNKDGVEQTINDGLASVLKALFKAEAKGDKLYSGQLKGKGATRFLSVDLSNLKMHGLHVRDEIDLMKVLDVYDALKKGKSDDEVTFILDGNDNGKFEMTEDTWLALETRLAEEGNKVSFALCNDEAPCKAIVLDNTGATSAAEIPELKFVKLNDKGEVDATRSADVTVELLGAWKYASVEKDPTVAANKDAAKVLVGIKELVVKNNLTLSGFIASTDGTENYNSKTNGVEIVVEQQANVTVSGKVVLQENMTNHGTITIPENTSLSVANTKTLVNREAPGLNATAWDNQDVKGTSGKIYNSGTLAIVDANPGSINNYGVIKIEKDAARTLISANADVDGDGNTLSLADDFINVEQAEKKGSGTKPQRIGSIFLANKDGGTTGMKFTDVNNTKAQGFIKLVIDDNKEICVGSTGIANYIIVTNNTVGICTASTDPGIVDYLEVRTTTPILMGAKKAVSLKGLLVPETNYSVNVPTGTSLTVTEALYLKGSITKVGAGTNSTFVYTDAKFKGYFGGDEADINNIYTSK